MLITAWDKEFSNGKKAAILKIIFVEKFWVYFLLTLKCRQNLESFSLFTWKVPFFPLENSLPYGVFLIIITQIKNKIQTCGINGTASSGIRLTDYVSIFNETALQQALANVGPVMLSIEMPINFQHYESGIFGSNADHCTGEANHAISFG